MYKTIKNNRLYSGILRASLILLFCIIAGAQLSEFDFKSLTAVRNVSIPFLLITLLLSPLNWFIEFLKYKLIIRQANAEISIPDRRHSFYAGMLSAFLSPNMIGNFIGRMLYFKRNDRAGVVIFTLIANFSQMLITLIMGLGGLVYFIESFDLKFPLPYYFGMALVIVLFYYFFEIILKLVSAKWARRIADSFKSLHIFKTQVLLLSFLRYGIFLLQYYLILNAFQYEFAFSDVPVIFLLFLFTSLTPGLFFGKIIVRESIAIWVLGMFFVPDHISLLSSISIWTINLLLPNLLILFILKYKFKSRVQ